MGWLALVLALPALAVAAAPASGGASFFVAEPRVGDFASYNVTLIRADAAGQQVVRAAHPLYDFEQLPMATLGNATGAIVAVAPLHIWDRRWAVGGDGDLVDETIAYRDPHTWRAWAAAEVVDVADRQSHWGVVDRYLSFSPWVPCGAASNLQDGALDLGGPAVALFPQDCGGIDSWWDVSKDELFAPANVTGPGLALAGDRGTLVFFAPAYPYPVRIVLPSWYGVEDEYEVVDLVGFHRGDGPPVAAQAAPAARQLAPIPTTPFGRWGPPDPGVAVAWPLADGVAAARGDGRVASFLSDHPKAFLKQAYFLQSDDATYPAAGVEAAATGGYHRDLWALGFSDGHRAMRVTAWRVTRPHDGLHDLVPDGPQAPSVGVQPDEAADDFCASDLAQPWRMPLPGGVLSWWSAYSGHGPDYGWADWGYEVGCSDPAHPPFVVTAGRGASYTKRAGLDETPEVYNQTSWGASLTVLDQRAVTLSEGYDTLGDAPAPSAIGRVHLDLPAIFELVRDGVLRPVRRILAGPVLASPSQAVPPSRPPPAPTVQPQTWTTAAPPPLKAAAAPARTTPPSALVVVTITAGLALAGWAVAKGLAALGLFSRLSRDQVANHPMRARLLQIVEAEPGIHLRELARRAGLAEGAARHHLAKLEHAGLLRGHRGTGYRCFFLARQADRRIMPAAQSLRAPLARQVLSAVPAGGLLSVADLAAATGLPHGTVDYHVRRLAEAGLLSLAPVGRRLLAAATPLGLETQRLGLAS